MTDNEIIKGLECCVKDGYPYGCLECPYHNHDCNEQLDADALSLINRQKAEKEALIAGQETLQKYIAEQKEEIERLEDVNIRLTKAEAIKEFAERLKTKASDFEFGKAVWVVYIDNLVKEMVGDEDG